jgi:toxin ParE1/3/4
MNAASGVYLTRRAALDLLDIYNHSRREWGEDTADRYMADLYSAMSRAAAKPESGSLRQHRVAPFLMIAARKHFIIYDRIPKGIAILSVLHQLRDIENLVTKLSPSFLKETEKLRTEIPSESPKRPTPKREKRSPKK